MKRSGYCLFVVLFIMILPTFCFGQTAKAIAVAGGECHSVALKDDGTVWAWGVNARGQLGNGTVENSLTPVQVVDTSDPIGYLTHVTAIAVGTLYSLGSGGHSLALKESGTVFAWGLNAAGQLGDGTQEIRTTAVQVIDSTDATGYLTGITAISAGAQHSLAVKQDGTLWAWGDNYYGQLGDGTRTTRWYPGQVSGFVGGTAVAGGYGHSLALKQDGSVWAWGNNGYGQLGSGDGVYRQLPVQVVDFSNGIAVAAGKYHSAALRNDGTVWTWGANPSGELGNGTWGWSTSQNRPVQVIDPSDPSGYLTHVIAIACGDEHAMALKEDGTVFAWGANNFGQLGDGTTGNKNTPVMVSALNGVTAIKGGRGHSLAVKGDGTAWAWGGNWAGQLGDGTTEPKTAPVLVSFPLQPERKLLSVRAAYFIVPGEEITDVIQYDNNVGITLEDAIAVYQLPGYFTYVSATKGGMFHEEEKQVYWMLGNLSPNEKGYLSVKVRVPWGIPNHTKLSMYADIAARNIPSSVNVDDYLAYTPVEVVSETNLTGGQISQLLSSDPELKNNYDHALSLGYVFDQVTQEVSFSDGSSVVILAMIDPEEYGPVFLKKVGDSVFMEKYGESSSTYSLFKKDGGYRINLYDGSSTPWGTWAEAHDESLAPLGTRAEGISQAINNCVSVCIAQTVPEWNDYIKDKFKGSIRKTCLLCQASLNRGKRDPDACSYCAREYLAVHREKRDLQYGEKIAPCVEDCERQSGKWQCVKDQIHSFCSSLDPILDILDIGFTGRINVGAEVYNCVVDTTGSRWVKDTGKSRKCYEEIGEFCTVTPPPAHCYKCPPASLNQYGAMRAVGFYCPRYATPTRRETESGGDPNAKSVDVSGQVIPGQKLTYTIEYENVGEGAAYGVFIMDELDPNLDETSLVINNGGTYSNASRLLSWDIGTLASKAKGSVTFSVNVKNGLPSGTEITNYADVYFPSVPEITPTNAVVNIVKTIAADPLTIEALSEEPTSITLTGRDSGSKALTYKVTLDPPYGTLEGKPPKLTYTSMEEFSGQDEFYYVVNNGIIDSDPARVVVKVSPNPFDTRPPRVRDTYPKADTASVHVSDIARSTDPLTYIPTITATFSEPVDSESITTSTFTVGGLTGTVGYNEVTRTAVFHPIDSSQLPNNLHRSSGPRH